MWILMVEALVALSLLVFIVWWTMYAGRPRQDHTRRQEQAPNTSNDMLSGGASDEAPRPPHEQGGKHAGSDGAQHHGPAGHQHHHGHGDSSAYGGAGGDNPGSSGRPSADN